MSLSFIVGNVLGRAAISYLIVLTLCCAFTKLRWRESFAHSLRWYSLAAVFILTLLGLGMAVSRTGGV